MAVSTPPPETPPASGGSPSGRPPGPGGPGRPPPRRLRGDLSNVGGRIRRAARPSMLVLAGGALVLGFGIGYALRGSGLQLDTRGPAPDAHLNAAAARALLF